ncbi:dTDP-L-rhamnose 4-epimerase [Roseivivax jejudonensis]|uniref:dTDP-L-rhamnose 4-epimerase n=1 Tax=Roseivivax jejudonensis TaxID=1529041 RepID=A0A1X6YJK5_9RHOB|nr:NAD-dependent epimerase/dehydratase family protein [Roseivivax jejudonensis]SLN22352.1 dTDP-L-rhamnose 4-epimerase [Roseivivax jejudonensis]
MGEVNGNDATRIVVTGANGFLGRAILSEAQARGLSAAGLVRRPAPDRSEADVHVCDLAAPGADLVPMLEGATAVIHAAAHLGGDAAAHERDTIGATDALLDAMAAAGVPRLVLVGSVAVYDTMAVAPGTRIDETSPVAPPEHAADAYAAAKIRQEAVVSTRTSAAGIALTILRAGAVYGPGRLWNAHLGVGLGPVLIRLGRGGVVPLVDRARAARALVDAAEGRAGDGILNLLDDDLPDRARFLDAMRETGWPRAVLPLPWPTLVPVARALRGWQGRPGLLREAALRARMAPFLWPNDRLRSALPDRDRGTFAARFAAAAGGAQ